MYLHHQSSSAVVNIWKFIISCTYTKSRIQFKIQNIAYGYFCAYCAHAFHDVSMKIYCKLGINETRTGPFYLLAKI